MGRATKTLLEEQGARVIGVDLRDAEVLGDLSTQRGRETMVERVVQAAGASLDGVVACAGLSGQSGNAELIVRVNYFGAIATLDGLRPLLAAGTEGRAAVIASVALLREPSSETVDACLAGDEEAAVRAAADDGHLAYASSKRAISRWVRRMAPTAAWAGAGIALNAVAPGVIDTPMATYLVATPEARAETAARLPQPLRELGRPNDVAALLVWLTSPANGFVTGQVIFADGGYEALTRGEEVF
jgi:NAD(P)-dependent dehydrogenase (short-subunit alcohol dehydrogenase family)